VKSEIRQAAPFFESIRPVGGYRTDLTLPVGCKTCHGSHPPCGRVARNKRGGTFSFSTKSTQNMLTQPNIHLALPASSFLLSDPPWGRYRTDLTLPVGCKTCHGSHPPCGRVARNERGGTFSFSTKSTQNMLTQPNNHLALPASSFLLSDPPWGRVKNRSHSPQGPILLPGEGGWYRALVADVLRRRTGSLAILPRELLRHSRLDHR